jgi:hypothetical protein
MRHLTVFVLGTVIIYVGFLMSFTGPEFALTAQPVYSAVLSVFALLAALLVGLPTRYPAIAQLWHHTPLGVSIALFAIILGWVAIVTVAFGAAQHATVANAAIGLAGLLAIDFGILHWPNPRGLTNR